MYLLLCISSAVDPSDKYDSARIPFAGYLIGWYECLDPTSKNDYNGFILERVIPNPNRMGELSKVLENDPLPFR